MRFTPEQESLRDLARDVFASESPPSRLREIWDGAAPDPAVWKTIASVGIAGVAIPEQFGGAGGRVTDLTLVLEEAGRAALPEPLAETAAIVAPAIATHGSDEQRTAWLPRIAAGEITAGVLLDRAPFAVDADVYLIERDGALHLVGRDACAIDPVESEDRARRLGRVDASLSAATLLTGRPEAARSMRAAAAAATACVLNGVSGRLLAMTVEYVRDRTQFGRPVGSFQAVKHKLATAWVALQASTAAAQYAMRALAADAADAVISASVAKAEASDTASLAGAEALQCHGGIGFTWEHDLHLWLKRGKALEGFYGTAAEHRRIIAAAVFDSPEGRDA